MNEPVTVGPVAAAFAGQIHGEVLHVWDRQGGGQEGEGVVKQTVGELLE